MLFFNFLDWNVGLRPIVQPKTLPEILHVLGGPDWIELKNEIPYEDEAGSKQLMIFGPMTHSFPGRESLLTLGQEGCVQEWDDVV